MAIFSRLAGGLCVLISCACVSLAAQAQVTLGVVENGRLVEQTQQYAPYYTLATGAMRKVNGVVNAEYSLYLEGQVTRYTWEMRPGIRAQESYDKALAQLKMADAIVIYQCQGRSCGSSHQWANEVFHQARLYGLVAKQSYAALRQDTAKEPNYYALYSTERGNKKVYLHLEMIQGMKSNIGQ